MQSFHMHNEHKRVGSIIDQLNNGDRIALISDAGTPGISDPGFLLARACIEEQIEIECLPGPTAFVPALVNSGFPSDRFIFEGFLPPKKGRQTRLELLSEEARTVVLYESPHKLLKTLTQICELFGEDRMISISRELTKMYEETRRGTAKELKEYYTSHPPKGEIVIVIKGNSGKKKPALRAFLVIDGVRSAQLFLDAGRFAFQATQVVQLGTTHITTTLDLDGVDQLAVSLENTLNTGAVRDLADGEGRIQATVLLGDTDTFESL